MSLACGKSRCETEEMRAEACDPPIQMQTPTLRVSRARRPFWLRGNLWLLFGFSIFYFADVCLRASEKYFWYDEFFTLHLSRLPGFGLLWQALREGADFNPPLLYLLTKASHAVFGSGLIGTRMPEIAGFWVFCLCLFAFVNRRAGAVAGSIAMLFPMLTGAFYYAYEARPYGVVLGFCGLALLCWQKVCWERSSETRRLWWLAGFSASLFAAFMMHCYALVILAPFAVTELWRTIRSGHIDKPMWIALLAPVVPALLMYVPLLRSYSSLTKGTDFAWGTMPNWPQVTNFYVFLLKPCLIILIFVATILVIEQFREIRAGKILAAKGTTSAAPELVLAVCFIALPAFGVMLGKAVHGPFFSRYFLSAVAGICILAGFAAAMRNRTSWMTMALAAVIASIVGLQFASTVWHRYRGWGEPVIEPVSGMSLDTTPGDPLDVHRYLVAEARKKPLPIAVTISWDFFYLLHYAPQFASRIYYIAPSERDLALRGFRQDQKWLPVPENRVLTSEEFLRAFPHSLIYCDRNKEKTLADIVGLGGQIQSLGIFDRHFLAEVIAQPVRR
jgi:hypothetical protein